MWPLLGLLLITPFTPFLDLQITHYFYTPGVGFASTPFFDFLYKYGFIPADATAIAALFLFILSYLLTLRKTGTIGLKKVARPSRPDFIVQTGTVWLPSSSRMRKVSCFISSWKRLSAPTLVMALTLLIGSGIIVHVILKDHWGRPRPKQIVQFGGQQQYRPYYLPDLFTKKEPSKSFPCGHCSTGFYFFCLAFIGWKEKMPYLLWGGLFFALLLGGLLSVARIAQGGHFFSDVLVSALIMWFTAAWCTSFVYGKKKS